jgi:hypothetical protein
MENAMNNLFFSKLNKKHLQTFIALAILLFTLAPISTTPAYALPPGNDSWQTATNIATLGIPHSYSIDTLEAEQENDEPVLEPSVGGCNGVPLRPGLATVWFVYTAPSNVLISLDTLGSTTSKPNPETPGQNYDYDTYIAVWTGGDVGTNTPPSNKIICNDDNSAGRQSQLGFNSVAGTTYWIQVAQYNGRLDRPYVDPGYNGGSLKFHIGYGSQTEVYIGGSPNLTKVGDYVILPRQSRREVYALDAGPAKVTSANGVDLIAALRDAYLVNNQVESFAQLMGLPREQLSDTYYFPAYNNVTLDGQLRFANVDTVATTVTVTIGGVDRGTYPLQPNQSQRVNYALDTGPAVIKSSGGAKIIAALRDAYLVGGQVESFVQLMGLPKEKLSDTYYFPAYNNVTLDGQLRFGNVDTIATDVTVTIGGIPRGTYTLQPSESKRVTYPLDTGPVVIKSSNGAKIIAALRDAYLVSGKVESFAQLMGLPEAALSDTYWFPAYNNITLDGQLRFANVDNVATTITVTMAGVERGSYALQPGQSQRVNYPLDLGPVIVQSSNGAQIIAALRDAYLVSGQVTSFVQLMGLPAAALSDTYWFPAYNNITLSGQLRFGVPY